MRQFISHILRWIDNATTAPGRNRHQLVPVKVEDGFRGSLALHRDRSQHRRHAARYEDLLN